MRNRKKCIGIMDAYVIMICIGKMSKTMRLGARECLANNITGATMIKIKVYDKATDKQTAIIIVNNMREYKQYLTTQIDHTKQYAFGVRI